MRMSSPPPRAPKNRAGTLWGGRRRRNWNCDSGDTARLAFEAGDFLRGGRGFVVDVGAEEFGDVVAAGAAPILMEGLGDLGGGKGTVFEKPRHDELHQRR